MLRTGRTIATISVLSTLLACSGTDLVAPSDRATNEGAVADAAQRGDPGRVERENRFNLTPRLFGNADTTRSCLAEGTQFGDWHVRYHGYGCVGLESVNGRTTLYMAPTQAMHGDATHAPLAVGPEHGDRLTLRASFETLHHMRHVGAPNPWEVAWLVWHFHDDEHFYYFIPKPDGWELGKRDPAYPGGQRFLATGTERTFPIGRVYSVTVQQRGTLMTVFVDGQQVVQFRDAERPYRSGRVALYSEDAAIRVYDVASL